MVDLRLNEKIVLVTGADDSLGTVICEKLVKNGAKVWSHQFSENTAGSNQHYVNTTTIISKLDSREEVRTVVNKIIAEDKKIDILINLAEKKDSFTIDQLTPQTWLAAFQRNLDTPFLCCQEILPAMIEHGSGTIINITSQAAFTGDIGPHYAASKSALNSFTKGLAREFKEKGIKVKEVCVPVKLHNQSHPLKSRRHMIEAVANKTLLACSAYLDDE